MTNTESVPLVEEPSTGFIAPWAKPAVLVFAAIVVVIGIVLVGLSWSSGPRFTPVITRESGDAQEWPVALAVDPQGRMWAGLDSGELVMIAPDGRLTTYTTANSGLSTPNINVVAADAGGNVWVGSPLGALDRLAPDGSWKTYTAPLPSDDDPYFTSQGVTAIAVDGRGRIWAGTYAAGLAVLEPDTNR